VADATVRALGERMCVLYLFLVICLCVSTVFSMSLGSYPQNLNKRKSTTEVSSSGLRKDGKQRKIKNFFGAGVIFP
jgi:hypothetical protein